MNRRLHLKCIGVGVASMFVEACRHKTSNLSCLDTTALASNDVVARGALGYMDRSPDSVHSCANCNHFTTAGTDRCGSCRLIRGPIHPDGWCRVWVVKS
jgi:hypothetical protein